MRLPTTNGEGPHRRGPRQGAQAEVGEASVHKPSEQQPSWPAGSEVSAHPRLALLGAAALCGLLLPRAVWEDRAGQPQRITHEVLPPGQSTDARLQAGATPALRGCCGAPTEFLWVFLDSAKEAVAGKPFRTRVFARDAKGRQARPADCDMLRVDLGLSGRARLSRVPAWRRAELELDIENEKAEVVEAEVRIESPDPTADVLLHTSSIRFASGPAHRFVLEVRQRSAHRGTSASTAWPIGTMLEVAVSTQDRFGNRVPLIAAGLGGLAIRSNAAPGVLELLPEDGLLRLVDGEGGTAGLRGLRPGVVEVWLEPASVNASLELRQDLRRRTTHAVVFSSAPGTTSGPPAEPELAGLSPADAKWRPRAEEVRQAFLHAWSGYRRHAWGRDELQPVSRTGKDTFGGVGMTVVDSLTTLWLMGLGPEFEQAAAFVHSELDFDKADTEVSVFELVIRGLGGLLGAHALSGRQVFLDRASELGDRLLPAFNTTSGLPLAKWNIARSKGSAPSGEPTILSEAGSVQLEFRALAQQTGERRFRDASDAAFEAIQSAGMTGLMPVYLTPPDIKPVRVLASKFAFGALADSYYEYLLKQWLQSPSETRFKDLWLTVMDELPGLARPRPTAADSKGPVPKYKLVEVAPGGESIWKMDHLSCYAPGMIALGLREMPQQALREKGRNETWWLLAEGLATSCVEMWTSSKSGLAPEFAMVRGQPPFDFTEVPKAGRHSFLRPETAESLFYLHRFTGDERYRLWGEQLFNAILMHGKVEAGFASVQDVGKVPTDKVDEMQSFVMAETLKYLYLLFSPAERLDLKTYVLNTEGHPLFRQPLQP